MHIFRACHQTHPNFETHQRRHMDRTSTHKRSFANTQNHQYGLAPPLRCPHRSPNVPKLAGSEETLHEPRAPFPETRECVACVCRCATNRGQTARPVGVHIAGNRHGHYINAPVAHPCAHQNTRFMCVSGAPKTVPPWSNYTPDRCPHHQKSLRMVAKCAYCTPTHPPKLMVCVCFRGT